jgi:YggT family protein
VGSAFVANFLRFFLLALWLLILGRVLMSWVDPTGRSRAGAMLISITEPILAPVRRLMPSTGMIDFSPLIVILILGVLVRAVT